MASYIEMPKLSDTMTEGTLAKWLKKEGDTVAMGDVIAEVETDKATMEMESFEEGKIHKFYVQEGEKAPLGAKLALLLDEGEEPPADADQPPADSGTTESGGDGSSGSKEDSSEGASTTNTATSADETEDAGGKRIKASPLAKKIAKAKGVKLSSVKGSGPGGRIVKADVEKAAKEGPAPTKGGAAAPKAIKPTASDQDERIKLSGMRSIIAERLMISKTTIPHFYLNIEVDAGPLMAFRKQINAVSEKQENGNKYSLNDFILKAVIAAAKAVPMVNASFDEDSIIRYAAVNLSVAIAVEDGLVTPVIRNADKKTLLEISQSVKDLAARARNKRLSPDEFAGGTITVSSLGGYGIDNFDAIINPPQAAILSIGTAKRVPVVNEKGDIVPGDRMWIGMSCDHRVIDGAVGATYLAELRRLIESPALMLV